MNVFTLMRDLETEGAMYADVDVRHHQPRRYSGPRMFRIHASFLSTGCIL